MARQKCGIMNIELKKQRWCSNYIMANVGKDFENQIRESILKLDDVYYYRLKDPAQSFNTKDNNLRFSSNNPYDFIMYTYPYFFAIENKSSSTDSLSWTMDKAVKGKNIKKHQIEGLFEAYKKGAIAGFLFNFRKDNVTYFMHIMDFMTFIVGSTKKSINLKDVQKNHGILVPQTLKKVNYNYDIAYLIEQCTSKYNDYKTKIPKN
jgi:penicillin-binding protein-related factor A (putative recombinase)